MKRDYYEVLGVQRDADEKALKQAYRALARQHHPDRNQGDPEAEVRFKEASEAYGVLADTETRKRYDRMGHAGFESQGPGGFDPSNMGSAKEIFEGLFGAFSASRRKTRQMGKDLTYELFVSFEEAALGTEKTIRLRKKTSCDHCQGQGAEPGTEVDTCRNCDGSGEVRAQRFFSQPKPCPHCAGRGVIIQTPCTPCEGSGLRPNLVDVDVKLPAGVEDGAKRSLRGGGETGPGGTGDLHLTIRVAPHPLFERDGADVLCTVPVTFPEACLGTDLVVPTVSGKVTMKLPAGTQSGKVLRIRGKGITAYGGVAKGDQLVKIVVEVPEDVSPKQRELIEALAGEMGADTLPQRQGFLKNLRELFG